MASVLFVVTIPTAFEEERLRREFLAKKYDLLKPEMPMDSTPTTAGIFPLKSDSSKTTTSTTTSTATPTTTGQYSSNRTQIAENRQQNKQNNDNAETISTTTIDIPSLTASTSGYMTSGVAQYDTFPKRRKSGQRTNILEELSDAMRAHELATTGSLKDMDINTTVSGNFCDICRSFLKIIF